MNLEETLEEGAHHFLQCMKLEYDGDKEAGFIIQKYIREGTISNEEEYILKTQFMDSLKLIGLCIPFALIPGASILLPILIKIAGQYNIDLMPSVFTKPENSA